MAKPGTVVGVVLEPEFRQRIRDYAWECRLSESKFLRLIVTPQAVESVAQKHRKTTVRDEQPVVA